MDWVLAVELAGLVMVWLGARWVDNEAKKSRVAR